MTRSTAQNEQVILIDTMGSKKHRGEKSTVVKGIYLLSEFGHGSCLFTLTDIIEDNKQAIKIINENWWIMANIINGDEILNAQTNPSGNSKKEGQEDWRVRDVLIVDDEEPLLLTIAEGLSIYKKYFNLLTATNGVDAVKVLKSSPAIDLVLTDLSMPKMDGFELLAYMNRNYPKIPVILMTAFGTPKIEEIVSSMGIYGYLEKPLDINIIADNIFAALAIKSGPADSAMRDVRNRELNKTSYVSGFFNSDDYKKTMP